MFRLDADTVFRMPRSSTGQSKLKDANMDTTWRKSTPTPSADRLMRFLLSQYAAYMSSARMITKVRMYSHARDGQGLHASPSR